MTSTETAVASNQTSQEAEVLATFDHHAPNLAQIERIQSVRDACKSTAKAFFRNCMSSADRTAALRLLHEAMMTANKSIVNEKVEFAAPSSAPACDHNMVNGGTFYTCTKCGGDFDDRGEPVVAK
jgi:transposase-like protein